MRDAIGGIRFLGEFVSMTGAELVAVYRAAGNETEREAVERQLDGYFRPIAAQIARRFAAEWRESSDFIEHVSNESVRRFFRRVDTGHPFRISPEAYFSRIVANCCLQALRENRSWKARSQGLTGGTVEGETRPRYDGFIAKAAERAGMGVPNPERELLAEESRGNRIRVLKAALLALEQSPGLGPEYAGVLRWRYLEGKRLKDLAAQSGLPAATIHTWHVRAKAAYRKELERRLDEDGLRELLEGI